MVTFFSTIISGVLSGIGLGLYIPVINFFIGDSKDANFFNLLSNKIIAFLRVPNTFLTVITVATLTIALGALITYFTMICSGFLYLRGYRSVKMRLINDLLYRPYQYFIRQRAGKIVSIITDQATLASNSAEVIFRYLTSVILGLVYFLSLFIISYYLTAAMFLLGGLMLFINYRFAERRKKFSSVLLNTKHDLANLFTETIIGIKTIKSMGLESFRKEEIKSSLDREKKLLFKMHNNFHLQPLSSKILTTLFASTSIWLSISVLHLSGANVIVFLMVATRLGNSLQDINFAWLDMAQNIPNIKMVMQYINLNESDKLNNPTLRFSFEDSIKLENVSFAYAELKCVVNNINMTVKKNQFIAFIGPSGEGKTTLLDLIIGLYLPNEGRILYDGLPLERYARGSWCKSIGVVSQDVFLFNESISKNIAYGDSNPDFRRINEVSHIAYLHDFIKSLKDGYDTLIGDRGIMLSGGQRQRIVLARALYHNPRLLILDEATSNLDSESERCIQLALERMKGRLTIIAVAHRLSTIRNADVIYCIDDGCIKEQGSHSELFARDSYYKKLTQLQAS